jgi:hypothetical protein
MREQTEQDAKEIIDIEITKLKQKKVNIEEEEKIKNKKALDLSKQLQKLKVARDMANKAIIETTLELNKCCTHEKVRTDHHNVSGGYLNKSEHWTYYYCELCGVKVDEKVRYGSFG